MSKSFTRCGSGITTKTSSIDCQEYSIFFGQVYLFPAGVIYLKLTLTSSISAIGCIFRFFTLTMYCYEQTYCKIRLNIIFFHCYCLTILACGSLNCFDE